jgi:uncharacterized damage-inducible protein DinB
MSAADLVAAMDGAWSKLDDALYGLTDDLLESAPGGGWTIKDLLGHIAAWNEMIAAVLAGQPGFETFGLPTSVMHGPGEDALNEALVQRWASMPMDDVIERLALSQRTLRERVTEADPMLLGRTFAEADPDNPVADDDTVGAWVRIATTDHVDDHMPRLIALADMLTAGATGAGEAARLAANFGELEEIMRPALPQASPRRDKDGWSLADHLAHLAAWDRELLALLRREPVAAAVGVDARVWARQDERELNDLIRASGRERSAEACWQDLQRTVAEISAALLLLPDGDLRRPRSDFDPGSGDRRPLLRWVRSCSDVHLRGHLPAITGLVSQ